MYIFKNHPGVVAHILKSSTQKAEVGGILEVGGSLNSRPQSVTLSKPTNQSNTQLAITIALPYLDKKKSLILLNT